MKLTAHGTKVQSLLGQALPAKKVAIELGTTSRQVRKARQFLKGIESRKHTFDKLVGNGTPS